MQFAFRLAMAMPSRVRSWLRQPTDRRQSQHTMSPAAHHTDTAPNTPPRLHPRSIQTRPTPRTRPRATRAPMPRCPNQRHIRGRPPTQIVHRIRWHRSITPRNRAPGPKLLTRANRWDIARMSSRTSGGPSGVSGLLDYERRYDHARRKTIPIGEKVAGRPTSTTATEPRAPLNMPRSPGYPSAPSAGKPTPCCCGALAEILRHLIRRAVPLCATSAVSLRACSARKILPKRTAVDQDPTGRLPRSDPRAECTHRSRRLRLGRLPGRSWRQRCSARRRSETAPSHP